MLKLRRKVTCETNLQTKLEQTSRFIEQCFRRRHLVSSVIFFIKNR